MKKSIIIIGLLFFAGVFSSNAQFIEDALRYSQSNAFVTARSGGLNTAFYGVSDDISALLFNPAGLALIGRSELSFGLGFTRNSTNAEYLSKETLFNSNNAYISNVGVVVPFDTRQGNASLGIAYFLDNNFDNSAEYGAFNPANSMIDYQTKDGPNDINKNMASHLYLASKMNGVMYTELKDSLYQSAFLQEKGGLHNIVGGAAFELSDYVSAGFTIQGKWGEYKYTRDFSEMDLDNVYNADRVVQFDDEQLVYDFYKFDMTEELTQRVVGVTGSIGVMGRIENFLRLGVSVKFPTYFEVEEDFKRTANAIFDNGGTVDPEFKDNGSNSYNLTTPFVYSAGFSIFAAGITFSGGVEYTDVTQMEFSNALDDVEALNKDIVRNLVGTVKWGVGVEYDIPLTPIAARASFGSVTSPYTKDIAGAATYFLSVGGGIYLADNIRLDGLFHWSDVSELRNNYGGTTYILNKSPLSIAAGLTYRY